MRPKIKKDTMTPLKILIDSPLNFRQLRAQDNLQISQWHKLLQSELGYAHPASELKKKHFGSPLGESVVFAALNESGDLMAVSSFFRMPGNLRTKQAVWQPGDIVTSPAARGKGLFAEVNQRILNELSREDLVIGFPNSAALNPWKKLGWPVLMETMTVRGFGWRPSRRLKLEALSSLYGASDSGLIAYIQHRFNQPDYRFSVHPEYFFVHRGQLCGVFSRHGAATSRAPMPLGYRIVLAPAQDRPMLPRYSRPSGHVIGRPGQTYEQTLVVLNQISPLAFLDTL